MEENLIEFSFRKYLGSTQTDVRGEIDVENLKNVLSLSAEPISLDSEVQNGELKFTGEICFNVVYIDNDNKTKSEKTTLQKYLLIQ